LASFEFSIESYAEQSDRIPEIVRRLISDKQVLFYEIYRFQFTVRNCLF